MNSCGCPAVAIEHKFEFALAFFANPPSHSSPISHTIPTTTHRFSVSGVVMKKSYFSSYAILFVFLSILNISAACGNKNSASGTSTSPSAPNCDAGCYSTGRVRHGPTNGACTGTRACGFMWLSRCCNAWAQMYYQANTCAVAPAGKYRATGVGK